MFEYIASYCLFKCYNLFFLIAASDSGAEMTDYSKISKAMPAYAVIINNKEFDKSSKREGSDKDEKSIKQLKSLNVFVKHTLKDLTADEMVGALKFLATKDPDNLTSVGNGRGALKLLNTAEGKMKKFDTIEKIRGGLIGTDNLESFEDYSCLMVFIMTHGSNNGILAGRDSSETTVDKLAAVFNSEQCKELAGKPKIFIIQACRGGEVDEMRADDYKSDDNKDDQISCKLPKY